MKTSSIPRFFPTIDVLRGFAALSVVIYHIVEIFEWKTFPITGPLTWFRIGWMGVDLFFVISGMVIGLAAFSGIDRDGAGGFRVPFFKRRLLRIVPLHYLTMLVFVGFIVPELLFERFWTNLLVHTFFVHNFSIRLHGAINGSNWSLATEMQFYVLMLVLAPWLRVTQAWKIFVAFVGVAWLWRYGVTLFVDPTTPLGTLPVFVTATQLPGMLDEFAVGILLARFIRSETGGRVLDYFADGSKKWSLLGLLAGGGLFVYGTLMVFWQHSDYWGVPMMVVLFRTLLALSFGVVLFTACVFNPVGLLNTVLSPLRYLGTISYGLYLWHLPVLLSLKRITWMTPGQVMVVGLSLTICFAAVSWHLFEQPFTQRFARKKKSELCAA